MTEFSPAIIVDGTVTSGNARIATIETGMTQPPMPEFLVGGPALVQPGVTVLLKNDHRVCKQRMDQR